MAMSAYASGMYGFYSSPYDRSMQPFGPYAPFAPPSTQQQSTILSFG